MKSATCVAFANLIKIVNPDESDRVTTVNFPQVMYYAPHISNEDIGGKKPGGMDPFVILPGHHGYMIQPLGLTERAALTKEYAEMLARLCKIKDVWCLPKEKGENNDRSQDRNT